MVLFSLTVVSSGWWAALTQTLTYTQFSHAGGGRGGGGGGGGGVKLWNAAFLEVVHET